MVALMWLLELADMALPGSLDTYGIRPRDVDDGLPGIVAAPFLHVGFVHLIGNTVPFVVMGAMIALGGLRRLLSVFAITTLVGGLGVWLLAGSATVHLGASGVVFGFAGYLLARGLFSRSLGHLALGAVVFLLYGGTLLFGLVPTPGVSWLGHLFGGIGGLVAARMVHARRGPGTPG